ncbi:hypothetical protein [Kamptonema sp. UHCC 0994]|uniref:hypothetical protein n=1 Tax=Kamptonema sp. UHCC 0994 TaxID=3031329 RepID=UPI0023B8DBA9|nr:hypothetical protein [Kamptonema sp. UHCC 0994]MDF0555711.1 hypothetical protein [Kamptonema sp. UHCC 0994]
MLAINVDLGILPVKLLVVRIEEDFKVLILKGMLSGFSHFSSSSVTSLFPQERDRH